MKLYNDDSMILFKKIVSENKNKNIIIVTDPPFNIKFKYNSYKDNMEEKKYYEMLDYYFHDYPSVVIHYPEQLYNLAIKMNKAPYKVVSWVYNSNFPRQHRDIAFFDIKPDFKKVRQPYKEDSKKTRKLIANGSEGARIYDWWNINQVRNISKEKTKHPCQTPIEVMKNIIGILPDDCLVIDPFMGSGTTGLAVKVMNKKQNVERDFIGIEIDRTYFKIAKERIGGNYGNKNGKN